MFVSNRQTIFVIHKKADWGLYYSEDQEIINFLANFYNIKIIDWSQTDPESIPKNSIVFCRCPSNWIKDRKRFLLWLNKIKKFCILINNFQSIKKGLDKNYLDFFIQRGVKVVPSIFVNKLEFNLKVPWVNCVIKPTVGESAWGVKRVKRKELNYQYLTDYYNKYGAFIIQKYQNEIKTYGSFSVVFVKDKYIYTVSTKTKKNNFLTSWTTARVVKDNKILIENSKQCLKLWGKCDYVRLDWLFFNNIFHLLEFEVVDPMFFYNCLTTKKRFLFLSELLKLLRKYENKNYSS